MAGTEVPYVNNPSAEYAREFEARFACLPPQAGVIFASVRPEPINGGIVTHFTVFLGINRRLSEETGTALVKRVLEKELAARMFNFKVAVYRGTAGAFRDSNPSRSGTLSS